MAKLSRPHPIFDLARTRSRNTTWDGLKWPLLEQRRNFLKLGHNHRFVTPFARTDTYLNSFIPSTINLWNSLPESLVNLDDINKFKEDLSLYLSQLINSI